MHRFLIRDALNRAIERVQEDIPSDVNCVLRVDSDTSGRSGTLAIADTIIDKIRASSMMIADVTPCLKDEEHGRYYPNPNVMLEVGVAAQALGWGKVVCLFNDDACTTEQLPFDIRHRRISKYHCESREQRSTARTELESLLAAAIRVTLQDVSRGVVDPSLSGSQLRHERDSRLLRETLETIHTPTLFRFLERAANYNLHYDVIFFWHSFRALVSSPDFRFYDQVLQERTLHLCRCWGEAIDLGDQVFHPGGNGQFARREMDQEFYSRYDNAHERLDAALKAFLERVHSDFQELDTRATDEVAWNYHYRFIAGELTDDPAEATAEE
ncbi:nucleoside 2-deoxyribosyltransferase [Novipirellula galeiformis]|uniref:nucleoside 2-deoxyribosyltransferase n=1 Tax=Novipirellula galeiformis TaxID=2528004 RepID=UPI001E42033E|nr:nucleoside 2-deoxyribosyltransferase [Novipirellula galeiformis]